MAASKNWKKRFLETLRETCNVRVACEKAGVGRATAYKARKHGKEFAKAWDEAIDDAVDGLEMLATKRAAEGSDSLLMFLLKAHRPEKYRERFEAQHSGVHKVIVEYVEPSTSDDDQA